MSLLLVLLLKNNMKKNLLKLSASLLFFSPLSLFALASGSVVIDPGDIFQNVLTVAQEQIGNIQSAISSSAVLSDNIKEYALDPIATKIAQDMINRASGDTVNWINSGFQGGGPGFIVNPDAYLKNIANQEVRVQLDALNKTVGPLKSSISVALVKNIRTGRQSAAAQMQFTLLDTVRSETCTSANLQKIAENQVDSSLTTTASDNSLSRSEKIAKRKGELNQDLCSAAAKNDPQANAKLQACFNSGACGGFRSTLDAFSDRNSEAAVQAKFIADVNNRTTQQQEIAKAESSNGIIPEKVCQARLQVDDEDNPYPDGEGPCTDWDIKTPVASVQNELQKSQSGNYGKLTQADEIGELIGNALLNQATLALYKGLNNTLKKTGVSTLNVTFDNLMVNNSKSLPTSVIKTVPTPGTTTTPALDQANVVKAKTYCANLPEDKRKDVSTICKHLTSNLAAQAIDTNFKNFSSGYVTSVRELSSCIQSFDSGDYSPSPSGIGGDNGWKAHNDKRNDALISAHLDDLAARLAIYPKSILTLSQYIVTIIDGKDEGASEIALTKYGQDMGDDSLFVLMSREKLSQADYSSFKSQVSTQDKNLPNEVSSCTSYLNQCKVYKEEGRDCAGNGGGGGTGSQCGPGTGNDCQENDRNG